MLLINSNQIIQIQKLFSEKIPLPGLLNSLKLNITIKFLILQKIKQSLSLPQGSHMNVHLEEDSHKLYNNILHLFRQQEENTHSLVNYKKALRILDVQANKIIEQNFNQNLLDEIWEHIDNEHQGQKQVIKIAEAFVSAYRILSQRIRDIESSDGILEDKKGFLHLKRKQINNYQLQQEDYHVKRISKLESECEAIQQQIQQIENHYITFKQEIALINSVLIFNQKIDSLQIRTSRKKQLQQQKQKLLQKQSMSLKILFYATFWALFCELLLMSLSLKQSLLSLLCYCVSFQVLFIGYFKYRIVLYQIVGLILSLLLDAFWGYYILVNYGNSTSFLSEKFIILIYPIIVNKISIYLSLGITIVSGILRVLMIVNWMKHISINKKQYYFILWGTKITLNKRVVTRF